MLFLHVHNKKSKRRRIGGLRDRKKIEGICSSFCVLFFADLDSGAVKTRRVS